MKQNKNQTPARRAYWLLLQEVVVKWHNAAPRVRAWEDTLVAAFEAELAGDPDRIVALPEGASTPDGETVDRAARVLEAFDAWLGRDIISAVLGEVQ